MCVAMVIGGGGTSPLCFICCGEPLRQWQTGVIYILISCGGGNAAVAMVTAAITTPETSGWACIVGITAATAVLWQRCGGGI